MKCEKCGINDANVRIEKNINGNVSRYRLCSKCAKEMNIGVRFSLFNNMFNNSLFDTSSIRRLLGNSNDMVDDFGFIDSGESDMFNDDFDSLLNNMSQSKKYNSKRYFKKKSNKKDSIDDLEAKLQLAIKEERYEDAAKYRDEIKKIKQ